MGETLAPPGQPTGRGLTAQENRAGEDTATAAGASRVLAGVLLAAVGTLTLVAGRLGGILVGRGLLLAVVLAWAACGITAAMLLVSRPGPRDGAVVLLLAVVLQASALTSGPQFSNDLYRYVWDGTVAAAGVDPYAYPPDAPELAGLRRPFLWPAPRECARDRLSLPRSARADPFANPYVPVGCTRLNRPAARTIYPPVAQLAFRGLVGVTGGRGAELQVQVPAALLSLALTGLLVGLLRRARRPSGWALLYAATPLAGLEAAMDAHVDVLAALFGVAALGAVAGGAVAGGRAVPVRRDLARAALVGLLLTAATLVKLYPAALAAVALPRLGLRRRRRAVAVAVAVGGLLAVAVYLPHVRAVGVEVIGYLPGYLRENDYGSGQRYLLLRHLLPPVAAGPVAAVLLLTATALALRHTARDADVPALAGVAAALLGSGLLVLTPGNAWYTTLLIACAALAGHPEWWGVVVANYVVYADAIFGTHTPLPTLTYLVAAGLATGAALRRRSRAARPGRRLAGGDS